MNPVSPVIPGSTVPEVKYAEDQPEYMTLPAVRTPDGVVLSRWELSDEELAQIVHTRSIYLALHTFNMPLQPIQIGVEPPSAFDYALPPPTEEKPAAAQAGGEGVAQQPDHHSS